MEAKRWRRRPVEVLAMQVPASGDRNIQERWEIAEWCGGNTIGDSVRLDSLGYQTAGPGDWIVMEPFGRGNNQFAIVPAEVFETAYEVVG